MELKNFAVFQHSCQDTLPQTESSFGRCFRAANRNWYFWQLGM